MSPTFAWWTSLSPVTRYPTSPGPNESTGVASGAITPASSASDSTRVCINRMRSREGSEPSLMRTYEITPRYGSNIESKINARSGASASPSGGGTSATIAASSSFTPFPDFAEIRRMSSGSRSSSSASSLAR